MSCFIAIAKKSKFLKGEQGILLYKIKGCKPTDKILSADIQNALFVRNMSKNNDLFSAGCCRC